LHIPLVGEKSGQGGMDDVPPPATPFDLDASLEPEAPLDPVAPTDLACKARLRIGQAQRRCVIPKVYVSQPKFVLAFKL
jgi:hypothetical protein